MSRSSSWLSGQVSVMMNSAFKFAVPSLAIVFMKSMRKGAAPIR
jgi:hypothetical protein